MTEYDVVLLVEQELTTQDATQIRGLHEEIEDPVVYHVLAPIKESVAQLEAGMGALGSGEVMTAPSLVVDPETVQEVQKGLLEDARGCVRGSIARIEEAGGRAVGEVVTADPIQALAAKVAAVDAREAIILTRPHVVAEFFHLDWTSRARRKLGVPVLHLLEHENFDEQAEGFGDEGVTGL